MIRLHLTHVFPSQRTAVRLRALVTLISVIPATFLLFPGSAASLVIRVASWTVTGALGLATANRWLGLRGERASRGRERDLFDGVPIGLYRTTAAGRILDVNPKLVALSGYPSRQALLATSAISLYVDAEDRERWAQIVRQEGEVRAFEMRMRRFDGSIIWVRHSTRAVLSADGTVEYEGALEDITERTRAEQALRTSEERYGAAFEQVAIGLAEVAFDGRFLRVNRYLCERLGYTAEELLSKGVADVTHPDDLEATRKYLREAVGWRGAYRREKRYVRKDGAPIWAQLTACVVHRDDAEPDFFISVVEDLTERKGLEAQLLHAQKLEAVGRLAGGVAHDFSNLIGAILGYAQLVERTLAADDPRRSDLAEIRRAGQRAAALIQQLLTIARRQESQPQLVDLNALLLNLGRLVTRVLGSDVELEWDLAPVLPAVRLDPGQFEQVILNLAINARDAMPEGGALTVRTSVVHVDNGHVARHAGARLGPHVVVTVTDSGIGMTREVLERAFEPFFTTKEPDKGTGLGLSICYGIVRQAEGSMWAYSEPGRGTTFHLHFPAVDQAATTLGGLEPYGDLPRGNESILLAEDDPQMRDLAVRVLTECGYRVHAVPDAATALASLPAARRPDLLLTDMVMPGMSGLRLAEEVEVRFPGIRVLCMTGQVDRVSSRKSGPQRLTVLPKPFTAESLARAVRESLDSPPPAPPSAIGSDPASPDRAGGGA